MDAFVKRCAQCNEPLSETTRGRPQKYCSDRCRQAHRKIGVRTGNGLRYRIDRVKPKTASQESDFLDEFEPKNLSKKTKLHFERMNEVTFKLTDGEVTNVPASHGQWGGYRTTKAVASVINIAPGQWLARCRDEAKSIQGELAPAPHLSSLCASAAQPSQRPEHRRHQRYRVGGTSYITLPQATNIIEAVRFAKLIGLPLVAHLSIHWSLTDVGDDPKGELFARFREGLNKWFNRRGIVFAACWTRERQAGGQSDVEHCHLLFHLPVEYRTGKKRLEVEDAMSRLVERHGRGILHEKAIDLRVHDNPDGKYLIKGGGRKIWKRFRLRKEHRRLQGIIHGKRCGTTENIGTAARTRWRLRRLTERGVA